MVEKSLSSLPFEVIEQIFRCEALSFIDICRLSSVCQIFNCVALSNKLWQNKYTQMWPNLAALYDANSTDWKTEFRLRNKCKKSVYEYLKNMSCEFYHEERLSNESFISMKDLCGGHIFTSQYLIDELERILYDTDRHIHLTLKYYARLCLRYVRHQYLLTVWQNLLTDNIDKLTLLKGYSLLSQWCQPMKRMDMEGNLFLINYIMGRVFELLQTSYPKHPAIKNGPPVLKDYDGKVLEKSLWKSSELKEILLVINEIMSESFYYSPGALYVRYQNRRPDMSIFQRVLDMETRLDRSMVMCVIFETVAAQFGVALSIVDFPGLFFLKWNECPHISGIQAYSFIDVISSEFKTANQVKELQGGIDLEGIPPVKALIQMCRNIAETRRRDDAIEYGDFKFDALELLHILDPNDMDQRLLLVKMYLNLNINLTQVISMLQEVCGSDPMAAGLVGTMYQMALIQQETQRLKNWRKEVKERRRVNSPDVQFAVGLIMKHKKYNYRCVIYGWHDKCQASEAWIRQMQVRKLPKKDLQPFYNVLVEDGTSRYAAQENLEIDPQCEDIEHSEIGRFFQSFNGRYYVANDERKQGYPDDVEACEHLLKDLVPETTQEIIY